jgi:hypothetical protein
MDEDDEDFKQDYRETKKKKTLNWKNRVFGIDVT